MMSRRPAALQLPAPKLLLPSLPAYSFLALLPLLPHPALPTTLEVRLLLLKEVDGLQGSKQTVIMS